MADTKRYQVISACVILPTAGPDGDVVRTLYRSAVVDLNPDDARVKHNAESGYIVEVRAGAVPGFDASGTPLLDDKPTVGDGNPGDVVVLNDPGVVNFAAHQAVADAADSAQADAQAAEVAVQRESAAAKLPEDGSAPDGRASQAVWVEYLTRQGYDYDAVKDQPKDDLRKLAEQVT